MQETDGQDDEERNNQENDDDDAELCDGGEKELFHYSHKNDFDDFLEIF
jgi:hypothetical protein